MRHSHLPLLLLLFSVHLFAQTDRPLRFEKIEGLSQNTVYSIMKDKQGFMWIATANGLNRFDGVEMKAYKPGFENVTDYMKGRIVRSSLLEDDDQIWFGTDLATNCFNKKKQKFQQQKFYINKDHEPPKEQTPNAEMFAQPLLRKDNYVWFASASVGVFALNTKTGKCTNYPVRTAGENGNNIPFMYNAALQGKEKLWFASINGLLCFDLNNHSWTRFLQGKSFYTVALVNDTLYLGTNKEIHWFDISSSENGTAIKHNAPANIQQGMVRRLHTDEKMNVWAGDQVGNIYCKTKQQSEFAWKGNINGNSGSVTNYPVYCLYTDTTGNLWVGADVLGLLKTGTSQTAFNHYPEVSHNNESSQSLFIHSIYEDENENVWLGTFQNGLIVFNKKTGTTASIKFPYYDSNQPYAKSVPLIKKDAYGNLWTSYSSYLYVKEKNKKNFIPIKFPIPAGYLQTPQLWNMIEYGNGWLMVTNIGLYRVEYKNDTYSINMVKGFAGMKIITAWHSPEGKLWIVPETGGISIVNNPDEVSGTKKFFSGTNVKALQTDSLHQFIWICTTSGLIAYNPKNEKYKIYTEADGLKNNIVYSVFQMGNDLWLSTNNGLSRGVMKFSDAVFPEIQFFNFTKADGVPANDFNTGAYFKGQSGNIYFGSTNGVTWFKPEDVKTENTKPTLQFINFLVNEKNADSLLAPEYISSIKLSYKENNLFFRFRGIDFDNGKDIRYKYQLKGWDNDWVFSNHLNEVRYNNLPNGKYVFKVRATNSSGVWEETERTISIMILPPFWKTWWFYTLSGVLIVFAIVITTRFFAQQKLKAKVIELEKQKEIDKERLRISREMHDDIGAGLTQITLMSESAKSKMGITGNKELEDIGDTGRKLVSNMSEIIWSLNPENKTLDQLCSYLREQLNKQLEYSGMEYSIQLPEHKENIILSNEQRRNILLVTKEIVNNAIKYSKATTINIKGDYQNGKLIFEVADNGIGFDSSKTYNGNGLRNMKQRMEELDGKFNVHSFAGQGSAFSYYIPLS